MRHRYLPIALAATLLAVASCAPAPDAEPAPEDFSAYQAIPGFVDL
jgi:hypothetical protein